jgi:hypothetical protein
LDESEKDSLALKIGKIVWLIFGTVAMLILGTFLYFMVRNLLLSWAH